MTNRTNDASFRYATSTLSLTVTPVVLITLNMAVVFAPGDKYMLRHLYMVAGIGGILVLTGAAVTSRWVAARAWQANKVDDVKPSKAV